MTPPTIAPEADAAAAAIADGSWSDGLPPRGSGGIDCGGGLGGFAADLMTFVAPLEDLFERTAGDPAGLYQASHVWEVFSGEVQTASVTFGECAALVADQLAGAIEQALEATLTALTTATHSLSDWAKVASQMLQLCVRVVEIMQSLVCTGFELLANLGGVIGDVLFGSWPWDISAKQHAIERFANNCRRIVDDVAENIDRALQALRELVRLVMDLYRALVPFHDQIDQAIGELIERFPPGEMLGPLGDVPGMLPAGTDGDVDPGQTPFPGSDQHFREDHPMGYAHHYDLGTTDMTTEQLNEMLREEFGHVFLPSRVGDDSQLNMQLTGEGQTIRTSLFGTAIPGVTSGDIVVQQVTDDGFVIAAKPGHPEYPGEVAFRLHNVDGHAVFEVTGAYDETILDHLGFSGETNPAYSTISDVSIWADMQYRLKDMMNYGR